MLVLYAGDECPRLGVVVETPNAKVTRDVRSPLYLGIYKGVCFKAAGQRFCTGVRVGLEAIEFKLDIPCAGMGQDGGTLDRLRPDSDLVLLFALAFL